MLEAEFSVGRLSGVKASFNGPALTYVMYADNLLLFSKANSREARVIDKCLDRYCSWSGQKINYNKSGLAFSKATHKRVMRSIKQLLQMKRLQKDTMYHGAPMVLSRSPTKSITQTIPVYTMSYFEIPSTICDNLDATTRRFSWKPKSSNEARGDGGRCGDSRDDSVGCGTSEEGEETNGDISCLSRKRSSGTLNAPWAQKSATSMRRAEMRRDPTMVRKSTKTLETARRPRISLSEKVRLKMTKGWLEWRKR
uniref:Reverse transcriptase domain-containing protein n=1 Tax=Fagus sylvatica TaxID=28930 RepID=A0A2N9I1K2_FAGSY